MKRILVTLLLASLLVLSLGAAELTEIADTRLDAAAYFQSPYKQITGIGDPFILYEESSGIYYMYCTGGYFKCWTSTDLTAWTPLGHTYALTEKSFADQNFWAPEVYKHDGAYYMVYSAARMIGGQKRHSIGIAKADSPAGPFIDLYDHPLYAPDYSVIDANLLFDDDGKIYLFYSRDCSENVVNGHKTSQSFGIEVKPDFSGTIGEPVLLTTPDASWELQSGDTHWNEGPCVFKVNGVYYLLYSANYYASAKYAVGYATASSPLGKYTKAANNPILQGDSVATSGTGHCNIFPSPNGDDLYLIYHSQTNVANPSGNRMPCIDKLILRADGTLSVNGPSAAVMQPVPSGLGGLVQKQNGVTVSSTCTGVLGNVQNAADGIVSHQGVQATDLYRFNATEGYIRLQYATPIDLHSVWVYGIRYTALSPKNVYAVVNDTYKTKVKSFSTIAAMTPAVLTFDGLPDGVTVSDVKLYFTAQDSAGGLVAISEILTVACETPSRFAAVRTYSEQFTDVPQSAWYHSYVKTAYEYKLANGTSDTKFSPDGKFTVAQALTAAANIHTAYHGTAVRVATAGEVWYAPYVDYCVQNGIITALQFAQYDRNITRGEMAIVFANILPDGEYAAVRSGSNPDVKVDMACYGAVQKLYNAGIVGGDAGTGNYRPNDEIARAEACVIFARIALTPLRAK